MFDAHGPRRRIDYSKAEAEDDGVVNNDDFI